MRAMAVDGAAKVRAMKTMMESVLILRMRKTSDLKKHRAIQRLRANALQVANFEFVIELAGSVFQTRSGVEVYLTCKNCDAGCPIFDHAKRPRLCAVFRRRIQLPTLRCDADEHAVACLSVNLNAHLQIAGVHDAVGKLDNYLRETGLTWHHRDKLNRN